jgi:hypothetical protein
MISMDGRDFDDLLRSLTESRRSLIGGALAALAGALGIRGTEAKKKKKKPCKKKCRDGCCTSKHGKCIKLAQQTPTRCGTGGAICSANCSGTNCAQTCGTCCADGDCIDAGQISNEQCGVGGEACFACPAEQICNAPGEGCCAPIGATCDSANDCCSNGGTLNCDDNQCCVPTATTAGGAFCSEDDDCCEADDVCDIGQCRRPEGASCQPGDLLCQSPFTCNGGGICASPEDCTVPCAELERCAEQVCLGVLNCCTQATFDECSGSEDFCGCITEGGECTRILL